MEAPIKTITQLASFVTLLGISSALGFIGKPTEMALAIVAGALGLAFSNIDKLSKFKGAGFEAEMRKVEAIIDAQTEPTSEQKMQAEKPGAINDMENRVLISLQKPGYTWRYAKTIAGEIGKSVSDTEALLFSLMTRGFSNRADGANGEIWAATAIGKSAQEQYQFNHEKKA